MFKTLYILFIVLLFTATITFNKSMWSDMKSRDKNVRSSAIYQAVGGYLIILGGILALLL